MTPLIFDRPLRFTGIIGTGGIGSGRFFKLNGDHTLGREESRSGHFLDVRDYCKQHIILHYLAVLLGNRCEVIPIGLIGDDNEGETLFQEMRNAGMKMLHVKKCQNSSTLFSFCFHYPDGSGGNMTTDNSASARVDVACIEAAAESIKHFGETGMVVAAPEVPLLARQRLLELGRRNGSFCTASFTSGEIVLAANEGVLNNVDLLAINLDEARALTASGNTMNEQQLIEAAIQTLRGRNDRMMISITTGADGSWCWDGAKLQQWPVINVEAKSTAGAGDAFYAGLLTGLATGMTLHESQELASLVASLSVTSPNTIHHGIDRETLATFSSDSNIRWSYKIRRLLNII